MVDNQKAVLDTALQTWEIIKAKIIQPSNDKELIKKMKVELKEGVLNATRDLLKENNSLEEQYLFYWKFSRPTSFLSPLLNNLLSIFLSLIQNL